MIHYIVGYPHDSDFPVYRQDISIDIASLKKIMGWEEDDECVFTYRLNLEQITLIEVVSGTVLAKEYELFLDCDED